MSSSLMILNGVLNITSRRWNDDAGDGLQKHMLIVNLYKTLIPHPVSPRQVHEAVPIRGQLAVSLWSSVSHVSPDDIVDVITDIIRLGLTDLAFSRVSSRSSGCRSAQLFLGLHGEWFAGK